MRRMIYKLLALGVGTLLIIMITSNMYLYKQRSRNEKYRNMPYGIKLANTGSSHGQEAFDYSIYKGIAFNFAMDAQSLEYDYKLIEYYKDHFAKDSILLIPISYFTFWGDELKSDTFNSKNQRYFSILDVDYMRFISKKDYYIAKYFSIIQIADAQIRSIFDEKGEFVANPQKTAYTLEEIGEKRAAYHLRAIQHDNEIFDINPGTEESLESLINLCKKNEITPVLITTPLLNYYQKWFSGEVLGLFYSKINKICADFNVNYLDYSRDKRFAFTEELFKDTDHLNNQGAILFTKIVLKDLERLKLLSSHRY